MKSSRWRLISMASRRGFTLIEMVISVALMTLILAAAYGCLRSGILSQKLVDTRIDAFQNARVALNMMTADLRGACRLSAAFEFLGMNREIAGAEADNLDFATHHYTPRAAGEGDFCEVSYFLRKNPGAGSLTLFRRRDATPDAEPLAGGVEEPLAEGVQSFRLEYYDGYKWHDEWGDPQGKRKGQPELSGRSNLSGLPDAVRITLSIRVSPISNLRRPTPASEAGEDPPFVLQTVARLNVPGTTGVASMPPSGGRSASPAARGGAP